MTYANYIARITETMKIRSTNYRLTSNDIIYLANSVFTEIAQECTIDVVRQKVTMHIDTYEYDTNALYVPVGNEIALGVMSIRDKDNESVGRYFTNDGGGVFTLSRFVSDEVNDAFLKHYDGEDITFNRAVIPDIETLDYRQQMLIFNALIEGMMMYTHDAIPNPTSSNAPSTETGQHYSMYQNAKALLKSQLPQRR